MNFREVPKKASVNSQKTAVDLQWNDKGKSWSHTTSKNRSKRFRTEHKLASQAKETKHETKGNIHLIRNMRQNGSYQLYVVMRNWSNRLYSENLNPHPPKVFLTHTLTEGG